MTTKTVAHLMNEEIASEPAHDAAASAFVDRARSNYDDDIAEMYVFGSTARGEARGLDSDVDVLIVVAPEADRETVATALREIAYDVMLEFGPVVELHMMSSSTYARYRYEGHPFIRNVVSGGRASA